MTSVDRITFQQTFPTGSYANMKLGIEMSLVPGVDDVDEAFVQAKKIVNDAFEKLNPHIVWNDSPQPTTEKQIPSIDRKAIEKLEKAIDDSTTLHELDLLYEDILNTKQQSLRDQFTEKKKSLTS